MNILGLIPARKDSKSIPDKNVAPLGREPLVWHVIQTGLMSEKINHLVCSTDCEKVKEICWEHNIEVQYRPRSMAQDDSPIIDVIKFVVENQSEEFDAVVLLQPTSPFLFPDHIDECVKALEEDNTLNSAQTIAPLPHNHHAFNQRMVTDGNVEFVFKEERKKCYNKQLKPTHYIFGNVVVTRTRALNDGVFAEPSKGILIDFYDAMDVDTFDDLIMAERLLRDRWNK